MVYRLEYPPNPNCLTIHLDQQVTTRHIEHYEMDGGKPKDTITEASAPEWIKNLFAIRGVEDVMLHPHVVGITKGTMFSWRKMLPLIVFALTGQFAEDGNVKRGKTIRWQIDGEGFRRDVPPKRRAKHTAKAT